MTSTVSNACTRSCPKGRAAACWPSTPAGFCRLAQAREQISLANQTAFCRLPLQALRQRRLAMPSSDPIDFPRGSLDFLFVRFDGGRASKRDLRAQASSKGAREGEMQKVQIDA